MDDDPLICYTTRRTAITSTVVLPNIILPLPTNTTELKAILFTLETNIKAILEAGMGTGYDVIKVIIKSIGGQLVQQHEIEHRLLGLRRLESTGVVFEAVIDMTCKPDECNSVEEKVSSVVSKHVLAKNSNILATNSNIPFPDKDEGVTLEISDLSKLPGIP